MNEKLHAWIQEQLKTAPSISRLGFSGRASHKHISDFISYKGFEKKKYRDGNFTMAVSYCWEVLDVLDRRMRNKGAFYRWEKRLAGESGQRSIKVMVQRYRLKPISETEKTLGDLF